MKLPDIAQKNMTCPLPWQPYSKQTPINVPININLHPASLARHPRQWTKEEVGVWLRWCSEEFAIEPVNPDKFDLNGKALCLLSRSDFLERLPKNGDVLYNCLQNLITKTSSNNLLYQPSLSAVSTPITESTPLYNDSLAPVSTLPRGVIFVPSAATCPSSVPYSHTGAATRSYVPIKPYPTTTQDNINNVTSPITSSPSSLNTGATDVDTKNPFPKLENCLDNNEQASSYKDFLRYPYPPMGRSSSSPFLDHKLDIPRHQRSSDCRLLWEFIYQLLMNTKYSSYVSWENKEEFVFRIVNPTGLAELWGQQKNRTNMTYEKLSRALRYYYRMNIIKKVQGKRLTYKFLQPPSCIQKGQRGAKPHGRLQVPYGEVSPQRQDPSLSDVRVPDYDSDANSMSDHSMDGIEEDAHNAGANEPAHGNFGGENQTNSPITKDVGSPSANIRNHTPPSNRNHVDSSRFGLETYYSDISRLHLDRVQGSNPFHLTSSVYASTQARYNLHYRGADHNNATTVYKPSPTYPVIARNNIFDLSRDIVKQEQFEINQVPPAHSQSPINPDHIVNDSLRRSYSYDFSTLHVPGFPLRPHQARSASPCKDQQSEPEDLSLRKSDFDQENKEYIDAFQQKPRDCSLKQAAVTRFSLNSDDIKTEIGEKLGEDENGNEEKDAEIDVDTTVEIDNTISEDTTALNSFT